MLCLSYDCRCASSVVIQQVQIFKTHTQQGQNNIGQMLTQCHHALKLNNVSLPHAHKEHAFAPNANTKKFCFHVVSLRRYLFLYLEDIVSTFQVNHVWEEKQRGVRAFLGCI